MSRKYINQIPETTGKVELMKWLSKCIGLALGGGGARGLAHIGVIRVLEQEEIPIDIIVGTSSGALIGGAYASGTTPDEMERKIDEYLNSEEYQSSAIRTIEKAHSGERASLRQQVQGFLQNSFCSCRPCSNREYSLRKSFSP